MRSTSLWLCVLALLAPLSGCPDADGDVRFDAVSEVSVETDGGSLTLGIRRVFPEQATPSFVGCVRASPLRYDGPRGTEVIVADANAVHGVSPQTGETLWTVIPSAPEGEDPYIVSTPRLIGDRLFILYHTTARPAGAVAGQHRHNLYDVRLRHLVSAIDLAEPAIDENFPPVELTAVATDVDGNPVPFLNNNNLGRAQVDHAVGPGEVLGTLYLTFGNARDLQPWHGWAFEVSLDAWSDAGSAAALTGWLVTTPEASCGTAGVSGSTSRQCGGGLWAPSGQLIVPTDNGYDVVLAPGNGQLDLARKDYANTLMRVGPGLEFDPECDPDLCADFDPDAPALDCVESCKNLFIPRLLPGQPFPTPDGGSCAGNSSLFECWRTLDYVGGSTPVHIALEGGPNVLVYPTKDGHVYLVDADHLGTLYDRAMAAETCGTSDDPCLWSWAGMIVSQPALTQLDSEPLVLISTFMPDRSHDAGVVAFAVRNTPNGPELQRVWEYPQAASAQAKALFRKHPSRVTIAEHQGVEVAWVVDTTDQHRRLHGISIRDGSGLLSADLAGKGYRFTRPLVIDEVVYVPSCDADEGPSFLEAYSVTANGGSTGDL